MKSPKIMIVMHIDVCIHQFQFPLLSFSIKLIRGFLQMKMAANLLQQAGAYKVSFSLEERDTGGIVWKVTGYWKGHIDGYANSWADETTFTANDRNMIDAAGNVLDEFFSYPTPK